MGIVCALALNIINSACNHKQVAMSESLIKWVDPMIGTSAHGHTFPGATLPFGGVQLSPDTHIEGWDWCSGYHYSDSSIIGFSHTHLSGTGRGDLLDILIMPFTGETKWEAGNRENPDGGFRSRFSHDTEKASPGYYSVFLSDYNIKVELTVSRRAGFHRYTFEQGSEQHLIVDLFHSLKSDSVLGASIELINDTLLIGRRQSRGWGEPGEKYWVNHPVYFAMRFSKPVKEIMIFSDREKSGEKSADGRKVKAALNFTDDGSDQLLVKVGISAVDEKGAILNVDKEISHWEFDKIVTIAESEWEEILSTIRINASDNSKKRTFYTALYHTCIAPFTYSDVDSRYRGYDNKIHNSHGSVNYTGFSLWDTFRATHPIFTLIVPDKLPDFIRSMLSQYDEYGLLPVWPLCASETNCMIGYHSVPVIVDAYLKDLSGIDAEKAYEAMKTSAMQDEFGVKFLKEYGYIPSDLENKSVSKTLEYAFDDWCLAQMAKKLGKENDYTYFMGRSLGYKKVYDPESQFMRGRNSDGSLNPGFDPTFSSYGQSDYVEGNAWQYSWFVPHDVPGLIELMGGEESFVAKLDALFNVETSSHESKPLDITGLIGEYAHGNEPSHHVAYLYNYTSQPEKGQEKLNEIMSTLYTDQPDGLCGNEDMGQMSAWYIFSALGFYPLNPCSSEYVFGLPYIDKAILNLPNGKQFKIEVTGKSDENRYVGEIRLNGKNYSKGYLKHSDILQGGELVFVMGGKPGDPYQFD